MTPQAHNSRSQQRKTQSTSKPEQTVTVVNIPFLEASFRKTVVAVGPMPPVAEKTNGEKHALFTSLIHSSYARCFSCS